MYFFCLICTIDDPEINISNPDYKYRAFLTLKAKFINTLKIKDNDVLHKIHLNYRLLFLRDTVCAQWLEDSTQLLINNVLLLFYF